MVRRTKEDAAATRDSILDAAERLFVKQGVSRTTLQHIASEAGVTRGAIYWHFEDKGALFNAMMERATMPFDLTCKLLDAGASADPLGDLRNFMLEVLRITSQDPQARRVFEIATLKMEFVDELDVVRVRRRENVNAWMASAVDRIENARQRGLIRTEVRPRSLAFGLWALLDGMIRNWMFEPDAYDLLETGTEMIDTCLAGLRVQPAA